ncbi:MAG: hypothetical protein DGJ47_000089 [Rickettsiaceae bacterium]
MYQEIQSNQIQHVQKSYPVFICDGHNITEETSLQDTKYLSDTSKKQAPIERFLYKRTLNNNLLQTEEHLQNHSFDVNKKYKDLTQEEKGLFISKAVDRDLAKNQARFLFDSSDSIDLIKNRQTNQYSGYTEYQNKPKYIRYITNFLEKKQNLSILDLSKKIHTPGGENLVPAEITEFSDMCMEVMEKEGVTTEQIIAFVTKDILSEKERKTILQKTALYDRLYQKRLDITPSILESNELSKIVQKVQGEASSIDPTPRKKSHVDILIKQRKNQDKKLEL